MNHTDQPDRDLRIAIVGAGIGGLALSLALRRFGIASTVYEQAGRFERIGSGINISPNAATALRGLGVMPAILVSLPPCELLPAF